MLPDERAIGPLPSRAPRASRAVEADAAASAGRRRYRPPRGAPPVLARPPASLSPAVVSASASPPAASGPHRGPAPQPRLRDAYRTARLLWLAGFTSSSARNLLAAPPAGVPVADAWPALVPRIRLRDHRRAPAVGLTPSRRGRSLPAARRPRPLSRRPPAIAPLNRWGPRGVEQPFRFPGKPWNASSASSTRLETSTSASAPPTAWSSTTNSAVASSPWRPVPHHLATEHARSHAYARAPHRTSP